MKVKDFIKKQTTIMVFAIAIVTIALAGVSYAIFFDVRTNSRNQVITAGTLKLTISGISNTPLSLSEPISTSSGLSSTPISYTVNNNGTVNGNTSNLPAAYSIYLYADTGSTLNLNKVKFSMDGTNSTVLTSVGSANILTESGTTYYKIDSGTLAAGATGTTKNLRVWVDEDLIEDEISSAPINLNMYIVTEVLES